MTDIIDQLSGISPEVAQLRGRRPEAKANAQLSFSALLEPEEPGGFSFAERYAVAAFVAGIHHSSEGAEFYRDLLGDVASAPLSDAVATAIAAALSTGDRPRPAGPGGAEGEAFGPFSGGPFTVFDGLEAALGQRLAAAFDFAHLLSVHPKDASPAAVGHLQAAGWEDDQIVSLAQLVAFLAFQLRVAHGLAVLSGNEHSRPRIPEASGQGDGGREVPQPEWSLHPRTQNPETWAPRGFVNHPLGWQPWVLPLEPEAMTEAQREALIRPERIHSPYFRLLARDAAALRARTLTDLDIFYNTDGGLGRAERELAATVVSRLNGCEFCASVHQARAKEEGGDAAAVDRLLEDGVEADLGDDTWRALADAAIRLTHTPISFGDADISALRAQGLDELDIIDLIYSASFFNWANRLMLSLGAADVPKRFRDGA